MSLEDVIAIALAVAAAAWLVRGWWRGAMQPPCAPRGDLPAGADGFVASDALAPLPPPSRPTGCRV